VSEEGLAELVASVREHGVMQPVVVRACPGGYQLVAGSRRLEAARQAGLTEVPAVIRECGESEVLELALVENLQREDINPIEEAMGLHRLAHQFGLTQEQIAQRLGRSRSAVANCLRLLNLPDAVRDSIARGQLSAGHGRALLVLDDTERMLALWQRILGEDLSVRQAEALAARPIEPVEVSRETSATAKPPRPLDDYGTDDANLIALVDALRDRLQTRVRLRPKGAGGQLVVEYYSDDDLDRIYGCIVGQDACEPSAADVE
jgi:ParB family chromosome partitioning protein